MIRTRVRLGVYVDLDPMPGTFHDADSAKQVVAGVLNQAIGHYNPSVVIDSRDVSKQPEPPIESFLEGLLDELKQAKNDDAVLTVYELIDQIAEERLRYEREILRVMHLSTLMPE